MKEPVMKEEQVSELILLRMAILEIGNSEIDVVFSQENEANSISVEMSFPLSSASSYRLAQNSTNYEKILELKEFQTLRLITDALIEMDPEKHKFKSRKNSVMKYGAWIGQNLSNHKCVASLTIFIDKKYMLVDFLEKLCLYSKAIVKTFKEEIRLTDDGFAKDVINANVAREKK